MGSASPHQREKLAVPGQGRLGRNNGESGARELPVLKLARLGQFAEALRWSFDSSFEMEPCIPSSWPEYGILWRFGRTRYEISVVNPERRCRGVAETSVDLEAIPLVDDRGTHQVRLVVGDRERAVPRAANLRTIAPA